MNYFTNHFSFLILDRILTENMNIVNNNNHTPIKTTGQHAEDRCCELVSPSEMLTGEQNLNDDMKQQNTKKKKRKCRGNRKAQHSRRRERHHRQQQIMNNDTNHMDQDLITIEDDSDHSEEDEQEQNHIQVCLKFNLKQNLSFLDTI